MSALLGYLVDKSQTPGQRSVSGYDIGIDILGRGANFDPNSDAIVRVYVGRLRKALTLYYATEGRDDTLRIDIPKGGYDVIIRTPALAGMAEAAPPPFKGATPAKSQNRIPSVAILPFVVSGKHPDAEDVAFEMADEIARKLSVVRLARVFEPLSLASDTTTLTPQHVHEQTKADNVVMGRIRFLGSGVRAVFRLIDCRDEYRMIWTFDYQLPTETEALFNALDETTDLVQAEIRLAILDKVKTDFEANNPTPETDADLLLRSLPTTQNQKATLSDYHKLEADCRRVVAQSSTALGQVVTGANLALMAVIDPISDTHPRRAEAAQLIQQALDLDPRSSSVMYCAFIGHFLLGQRAPLAGYIQRMLELDPWHPGAMYLNKLMNPNIGPDPSNLRERLAWLEENDRHLSRTSGTTSLSKAMIAQGYISLGDFESALYFARKSNDWFRYPISVYRLAMCLMKIGKTGAALEELQKLRKNWPTTDPDHYALVAYPRQYPDADENDPGRQAMVELASLAKAQNSTTH